VDRESFRIADREFFRIAGRESFRIAGRESCDGWQRFLHVGGWAGDPF
jgi:hypothetical protein